MRKRENQNKVLRGLEREISKKRDALWTVRLLTHVVWELNPLQTSQVNNDECEMKEAIDVTGTPPSSGMNGFDIRD
jgi:hypothetical protein